MFNQLDQSSGQNELNPLSDSLAELERNTASEIRRQRSHERHEIKAKVVVRSGNTSELAKLAIQGMTGDISQQGCRILLPRPLHVGDIYRLAFDDSIFNLPLVFARCIRCRLIREDAYEVGCNFFSPLELSGSFKNPAENDPEDSSTVI